MMKHDAILAVYTNVVTVIDNEDGTITCKDVNENIVDVDVDAQAVTDKDTELTNAVNLKHLRYARNQLLADTDHWDASDTPAMSQAQIDYRQSLRDITNTYTSLDTVVWPTKP